VAAGQGAEKGTGKESNKSPVKTITISFSSIYWWNFSILTGQ